MNWRDDYDQEQPWKTATTEERVLCVLIVALCAWLLFVH